MSAELGMATTVARDSLFLAACWTRWSMAIKEHDVVNNDN